MQPSIGRIVLYTLTEEDAKQINRRRTSGADIAERIKNNSLVESALNIKQAGGVFPPMWPLGAQAHIGNAATAGEQFPCVIVRVWPNEFGAGVPGINGQVLLDANDQLWITSVGECPEPKPGTWNWPPRV